MDWKEAERERERVRERQKKRDKKNKRERKEKKNLTHTLSRIDKSWKKFTLVLNPTINGVNKMKP